MASKHLSIANATRASELASDVRVADTFFTRFAGLLFSKPLQRGEGLLIKPCSSIHMLGMKFSIDAVFFDKDWKVVGLLESFCPGQISRFYPTATCVLELPAGAIADSGTRVGDVAHVTERSPGKIGDV